MSRVHVSLIQSDFGRSQHGNFEAVIVHDAQLWHWFRDNSRNDFGPWARGLRITGDQDIVAGPGCLIQSDYRTGSHGNFEVIVPLRLNNDATELRHFYRNNSDPRQPWIRGPRVTGDQDNVAGPGCLIQSDYRTGSHANFEVIVPLRLNNDATELRHFYRNNGDVGLPWKKAQFITQSCAGAGSLIQSRFGPVGNGNFEVIADEPRDAVVHYWHSNLRVSE